MRASQRVLTGARTGALAVTAAALLLASGSAAAAEGHDRWGISGGTPSAAEAQSLTAAGVQRHVAAAGLTPLAVPEPKVEDCRYDLDGEGSLDPTFLGACLVVDADVPATPFDETSVLWVEFQMSSPTNNANVVEAALDTNGDDIAEYYLPAPGLPTVEKDATNAIYKVVNGKPVSTGQGAVWWRVSAEKSGYDGYLVGLDWRALGLTRAGFSAAVSLDDNNWSQVPATGFSALQTLPPDAAVRKAPTAPRSVSAVAGDGRATVKWARPLSAGTSPVTRYTVVASPGGRTCTTSGTSCAVPGLTNQKAYQFRVRAKSAVGFSPWSALSNPVVPKPYAKVKVQAKSHASKLKIDVNPNKGKDFWSFTVQKRTATGAWANVGTYRTQGKKETRTINLPKGTYRAVVAGKFGYQQTVSGSVYLKK